MTVRLSSEYGDVDDDAAGGYEKSTARRWQMRAPRSWPPRITLRGVWEVLKTDASDSMSAVPTARLVFASLSFMGVEMP